MENIYKYYCYLDDSMGIDTSQNIEYSQCNHCDKKCSYKDKINNKCYKDPDRYSSILYQDMALIFNKQAEELNLNFKVIKDITKKGNLCLKIISGNENITFNGENDYFTSDYIGPSRSTSGAKYKKVNALDENIGKTLRICRTIGGHIFWQANQINQINGEYTINYSINYSRGGSPLYDRIDYALAELKNYLDDVNSITKYSKGLFEAFGRYQKWFSLFGNRGDKNTFQTYIKFFFLDDFLDENGNVLDLSKENENAIISKPCTAFEQKSYEVFSDRLSNIIYKRTEKMVNFAKNNNLIIEDIK